MVAEEVVFSNHSLQLAGTLYQPDAEAPSPALVVLHAASGGTRQYPFYQHLTTRLPAQGIAVLLYDRQGSGQSDGDFETASFASLAEDGIAAVDYLRSRKDIDQERIGMYGISQGGWLAPIAAARKPDIAWLIIVSGCGVSPAQQMDYAAAFSLRQAGFSEEVVVQAIALRHQVNAYYRGKIPREIVRADIARVQEKPWFQYAYIGSSENLPQDVTHSKWYYELDYDPRPVWSQLHQPVLFIFAEQDRWVPLPESISNYRLATAHLKDVTLAQIEGTDHLMGEGNGEESAHVSERYIEMMTTWLAQRVGWGQKPSCPTPQ